MAEIKESQVYNSTYLPPTYSKQEIHFILFCKKHDSIRK